MKENDGKIFFRKGIFVVLFAFFMEKCDGQKVESFTRESVRKFDEG